MKFTAVISKPKIKKDYKSLPKALIITFVTILLGIICSVFICHFNFKVISDKLFDFYINFTTEFTNKNFAEIFSGILLSNVPYIILLMVFGTCFLGIIPIIFTDFFCSFGLGCLVSYIVSSYKLRGIEYFLLTMFPGKFIFIFTILFLSNVAISSSANLKSLANKKAGESYDLKRYVTQFFVGFGLIILSAFTDTVTIKLFSSLFNFG